MAARLSSLSMQYCLIILVVASNVFIALLQILAFQRQITPDKISYTYTGSSIPLLHPMTGRLPLVSLTLQETTHFSWNSVDNATHAEFETLFHYPSLSYLGGNHRMTILSWFHNIHCIAQIRAALVNHSDEIATPEHFSHCLQYLRQTLLCCASDMLEKGDFMERDFTVDRVGSDLVCYDWEEALDALDMERKEFERWKMSGLKSGYR
ncbi:hypothetical protein EDD18DRAFT_1256983 [Armillaria luteobubalina]|uniref:Uncharacterized protein n=1 Tax=Armillaria luteobubalina TaxID=153913 RepID=A0AA39ULR1_9AGAR|nr:hypothetical protein EDD18DRAFT_1256983 [Armillaria luteobubalina]